MSSFAARSSDLLRDKRAEAQREEAAKFYPESLPPSYFEEEPTVKAYFQSVLPHPRQQIKRYFVSMFPIATWIYRYNVQWFLGDLIAGVTIGAVVVPQGMAYAKIATLPVQYGLYSSFVGVAIYFMFATSKDITIGPVAVMSALVGDILTDAKKTHPHIEGHVIASAVALIAGSIVMGLGLLRLGFIVDFIPLPSIAAFMTGSAINIIAGQVPTLLGNNIVKPTFNTRASTYKVIINTLKNLHKSRLDSAFGVSALALLYVIKWSLSYLARRFPKRAKFYFFLATLRTAFVILLFTLISWLVNRNHRKVPLVAILGTVPRGFQEVGVPIINSEIVSSFTSYIPSSVIVLLIEHIAISKSFGRVNNYVINPNQELIAIGITNVFGPFFGAYPATGSFSRTAIKSKAGVRTPLAGVITAIVVVIAIYALPPVFFYIPSASLSAVIIHAVADLCATPRTILQFWQVSPIEFAIFWIGVIVTIFTTIEIGIYTTVSVSAAVLLFRIAKSRGTFVGAVKIGTMQVSDSRVGYTRNVYVPLDNSDGHNPLVRPSSPPDGVFIYRFNEGFLYPNCNHFTDHMTSQILTQTRPGKANPYGRLGDRPWNDPGPRHLDDSLLQNDQRPQLRALVLDFSGVPHLDLTGLQNLIDVRNQLDRHAGKPVQWRFTGVSNPWIKRALIKGNFGVAENREFTMFSVAHVGQDGPNQADNGQFQDSISRDIEGGIELSAVKSKFQQAFLPLISIDRPYFHVDIDEAIRAIEMTRDTRPSSSGHGSLPESSRNSVSQEQFTYSDKA